MSRALNETQDYLLRERGTIRKHARLRWVLCYPHTYDVAASSLGWQWIYQRVNAHPETSCERAVYPGDVGAFRRSGRGIFSMEHQRPLGAFDVVAFSIAFDPDLLHLIEMLERSGIPPLASLRGPTHPLIVAGGPLTFSNALPLGPFADVVVLGDAEGVLPDLLDQVANASDKEELVRALEGRPGLWIPALDGDRLPPNATASAEGLPAVGQIVSPDAELKDMFLIESSRGCPRMCSFCVVRATVSPMREASTSAVLDAIPEWAPRVGFVGAAVSDASNIKELLSGAISKGKGVGVSSLRADRLDEDFVSLLKQGGYQTLTVASDAPSERQRARIMKGIRERHLIRAAELARWAKLRLLKLYMIVGLPGEEPGDLEDSVALCTKLRAIMPLALTLSPFVPKLHTPLCAAPFEGIAPIEAKLREIRRRLGSRVDVRAASARQAWLEYRLSQGGLSAGHAALEAYRDGGSFGAWKRALDKIPNEHEGLDAIIAAGLWSPDGVEAHAPRPPRPLPRLQWKPSFGYVG